MTENKTQYSGSSCLTGIVDILLFSIIVSWALPTFTSSSHIHHQKNIQRGYARPNDLKIKIEDKDNLNIGGKYETYVEYSGMRYALKENDRGLYLENLVEKEEK